MLRGLVCNKEKLFHTKVEMITHSVHTFRNCSVVHDLSTSKDYSTILYKFVCATRKKIKQL